MDSLPPAAIEFGRIPLDQVPRVPRDDAINTCLDHPFEQYNFGDVPDWIHIMSKRDTPVTVVPKYQDIKISVFSQAGAGCSP